jgi:hypothetical protein
MENNPVGLIKKRPAETAMPITTVLAILIAKLCGVEDTDTIAYLAIALSFIPAVVTWIVDLVRKPNDTNTGTTYEPSSSA